MAVAVDVLGPLRVLAGDAERPVGGRRERMLLALLASTPGRHVGDARLVDELWGDDPPAGVASALQVAVSRVRRALGGDAEVRRDPAGYTLLGAEVDAVRATEAAGSLAGRPAQEVVAATAEALGRWRGTPYAGLLDAPSLAAEATRLDEVRLALVEARAQALLDLGRAEEAHGLLVAEAPAHPFRERLWSLLALAQYRGDRQADALETLRTLRTALVEELGVDPSATVRTLEERLLAQDPTLDGPAPASSAADATRGRVSGVVGRAAALAAIHDAIGALVERAEGGVLLISGEAGIGKSMLAAELTHRARERGATVLVGRCHEADLAPPYWPWLPVLRDLTALVPDLDVPEVSNVLDSRVDEESLEADPGAAAASTLRTFAAAARLMAAGPVPLVVVLEDLHWADQTSLRLLAFAAEELRDRPALFVATVRTVDAAQHPHLAQALASLARLTARRVPVPALDEAAVAALVADVVEDPEPGLVHVLTQRSDGNPFFVLEMARLLVATGEATEAAAARLDVPDGIADVLRLRLLQLDEPTRATLGVASVVGRSFEPAVLAEALDRLRGDTELIGEVAHHHALAAAYRPEAVEAALTYGEHAARAAEGRGAFDEAAPLWERVLEVEGLSPVRDRVRRHRLLVETATARQRVGDMHGMLRALDEAIRLAQAAGDHRRMAEAAVAHRSSGVWHWREVGEGDPAAVAVLEECLEHVDDPALRALLYGNLGLEQYMAFDFAAADASGRRSLELARESGERTVLRDCLAAREVALFVPGGAAEREVRARESLTVVDDPEYTISARFHLATALHYQGRGAESDEAIAPAYELAARMRFTGSDVPLAWFRWLRAVETGDPDADEIGRRALAQHRRTTVVGLAELTGLLAIASLPVGTAVPRDIVAEASDHPFRPFRAVVAHAQALAGDHASALRLLGDDLALGGDYGALLAGCLAVEVLRLAGDDRLAGAVEQVRPFAHEVATYGSVQSFGSAALFVGSGLVALGEQEEGRALVERAVQVNEALRAVRWGREARDRLAAL
jgi:DNA-binding SARP family transcriptional activator/tetratricopeptide (TPR) repeat protein